MQTGKYEFQSEFARKYVSVGEARGEAKGLLKVLKAKGFEAPPSLREHVLGCVDGELVKQWYERAVRAERLEDIFEPELLG